LTNQHPTTHSPTRRWLIALLTLSALLIAAYIGRAPLLSAVARAWVIDEPVEKADAVVALGGGLQYRTFEAARLYHAGLASTVLIISVKPTPTDKLGLTEPERDLFRKVLLKKGVPEQAIVAVGNDCTSSYDDAIAVRDWMLKNHARTLIAPTDIFHTRRLRWLLHKIFRHTGIQVRIDAMTPEEYSVNDWWRHEEGLIAFQNEVIKFGFYLLRY
jgi:uncharacterized SAM-binding protein YcdF (DUF218 family)